MSFVSEELGDGHDLSRFDSGKPELDRWLREFARHDWDWYRHLSVALADHAPLDVAGVGCPVTFLAGRFDSLVDVADVRTAARTVAGARFRELLGTHFLPLQYPEVMLAELGRIAGGAPTTDQDRETPSR